MLVNKNAFMFLLKKIDFCYYTFMRDTDHDLCITNIKKTRWRIYTA
jgi:hypothetical protein